MGNDHKNGLGKMPLPTLKIAEEIESLGFQWLPITPYHAQNVLGLVDYHKDLRILMIDC